jgi:serine/threonine protein kinase
MELVDGGELFEYITSKVYLTESESVRLFRQLISAVGYFHQFGICHRDLKPENVMLDANYNLKVIDFGYAAVEADGSMRETPCGSPHYAAPEICQGQNYSGEKVDIWSCGVILYVMLCGRLPFGMDYGTGGDSDVRKVMDCIVEDDFTFPRPLSCEAQDLVERILKKNPEERIHIEEMWQHDFLKQYEYVAKDPERASTWLGGPPAQLLAEDCGPVFARAQDVDREVLRAVCILLQTIDDKGTLLQLLDKE